MVSTITSLNSSAIRSVRSIWYERRTVLRASVACLLLFVGLLQLQAQTAPTFTVCPGFPALQLPAGDGGIVLNSTNIPALLGVTAVDPDGNETITYSASPSSFTCADIDPFNPRSITVTATDSDGSDVCNINVFIIDGGPFAQCTPITINLDNTGNYTLTMADINTLSAGSSACSGIASVTVAPDMFDCTDIGTPVQVTVTVEDNNTLTAFCLTEVTVLDEAPVAMCVAPFDLALDGSGNASITTGDIDDGSTVGSCSSLNLSLDVTDFDCTDIGPNTVTLTVDDGNGQTATCTTTVTIQDNDAPVASCNDITVTLDATGNYTLTTSDISNLSAGTTDNCDFTVAVSQTSFDCSDTGSPVTVTVTITDDGGNTDDCMADITVQDTEAPSVTNCPSNGSTTTSVGGTGDCAGDYTWTHPTFSDNCSVSTLSYEMTGATTGTVGVTPATGGTSATQAFNVGTTTVTYTAIDPSSNTNTSCSFTVTVTDDEQPVISGCPTDFSINNAGGNCFNTASWTPPTASDNCPGVVAATAEAEDEKGNIIAITNPFSNPSTAVLPVGVNVVSYTFTDVAGNVSACTFEVTVIDTEAPTVTCPGATNQEISSCNAANEMVPDFRALASYSDNCGNGYTVTQSPAPGTLLSTLSTPVDGETYNVTITITDNNSLGQSDDCTFTVTIVENDAPQPSVAGAVLPTINTDCGPIIVDAPTALDACGNLICGEPFPATAATIVNMNCGGGGGPCTPQATQTSTDVPQALPDNSAGGVTSTLTISGMDPIIDDVDMNLEITHTWVGDLQATLTSPNGTVIELFDRPGVPASTFGCAGNDLDVTFDDDAANSATDFENTCNNAPAIDGDFQPNVPLSAFNGENPNGTWTLFVSDNAAGDLGSITGWSLDICTQTASNEVTSYEFPVGTSTITWIYDDGNGNSSSQLQQVIVADDTTPPDFACQDIEVELDASGNAMIGTGDLMAVSTVTITGGDTEGNTIFGGPTGTTDLTITIPMTTTLSFDWDYTTIDDPTFDQFGYVLNGSFVVLANANGQSGTTSVPVNMGDEFAFRVNTADNTFGPGVVTISNFSPGFSGDFSVTYWDFTNVDADGFVSTTQSMASDNCTDPADLVFDLSQSNFDCDDIGENMITLTVTDEAGNSATCMSTVTVVDNIAPSITGVPSNVTVDCDNIPAAPGINVIGGVNATDNCDVPVITPSEVSTQTGNENNCGNYNYTITRSWSASDDSGNTTTLSQVITVEDTDAPTNPSFNAEAPSGTISTDPTSCTASVSLALLDLDDCAPYSALTITNDSPHAFTNGANASGDYPVGAHTVTFTATDPCGNSDSWQVSFTVADQVAPIASCQNGLTLGLPSSGILNITPALVNNNSLDNCSDPSDLTFSVSPSTFDCDNADGVTQWPVTLTVTDEAGNSSTCNTFVVVQDNNDPTALCQDVSVTLLADGTATISANQVDNGSFDDCDPVLFSYSVSPSSFGLGDVGNSIDVTLTVSDSSGNTASCDATATVRLPETCFDAGTTAGASGTVVSVPVVVDSFINVQSFQFIAVIDDSSAAEFTGVSGVSLPGSSFTANLDGNNGDTISISWFNDQIPPTPVTLPDGSLIFNFEVLLTGDVGDFSLINITSSPSQSVEVIHDYNGTFFNLVPCLEVGAVAINNPAMLEVAGTIYTEDGLEVALVDVTLENTSNNTIFGTQTTDVDGAFSFSPVGGGSNYEITPFKDINWTNGVTAFDLFTIQSHIVGLDTLDSDYKKIAANAFPDSKITTFDVVRLHQLLASLGTVTPPGNTSWRFVPAEFMFAPTDLDDVPAFDETKEILSLNQDSLMNDFIAVKVGNVVGPVDPTMFGDDADDRSDETLTFRLQDRSVKAGETVQIDFLAKDFRDIVAYQWLLNFDATQIDFVGVDKGQLHAFGEQNVGQTFEDQGQLVMLWYNTEAAQLEDDAVIFSLQFSAREDISSLQNLFNVSNQSELIAGAYKQDGLAMDIQLEYLQSESTVAQSNGFALFQNQPNPFLDETVISFTLPTATSAKLTISDITGRVLKVIEGDFAAGYNQVTINRGELSSQGVLYYQLDTPTDSATKKMIAVE